MLHWAHVSEGCRHDHAPDWPPRRCRARSGADAGVGEAMTASPESVARVGEASPLHPPAAGQIRAQRLAWSTIVGAFLVWCILVVASADALRTYVFTAANPQQTLLEIDRGVVFYQDTLSAVQARAGSGMAVAEGTLVEAADQTEASLALFDGSSARLYPGSQVKLDAVRSGRFSDAASQVTLSQPRGAARYLVAGSLPNGEGISVSTPHGTVALQRGDYLVWVHDDATSVSAYAGKGHVQQGERVERFRFGQTVRFDASAISSPQPLGTPLIRNGAFSQGLDGWDPVDVQEKGRKDVPGVRTLTDYVLDGRALRALRVTRTSQKLTHNETGLEQAIDQDVLPYRNLYIRAWVRADYASLSGGGYAGSEYPMMLQVDYVDANGGRPGWSHGFYYANPENRPVINAELVQQGTWLYYQGNLAELRDRPAHINAVRVFASGHSFDATLAQIELIAE